MASISSNTDSALSNVRMMWSNTSSWVGGVVPGILDDVTITSTRTTMNQSNLGKWGGALTITVASTSGFPSSGSFYTYTTFGDYVKVNYVATTSTTFNGCTVDYTDPLCNWKYSINTITPFTNAVNYNSYISNGAYIYAQPPVITIPAGYQANVSTMIIQNGGTLKMEPGSNLGANNWITVRDGFFIGRANVGNVSTVMVNRLEGNGVGYFQTENYQFSILDVDGGETRAYATVNTDIAIGSTSITINPVQGSFAIDDEVAIYDTSFANTRCGFYPNRDIANDIRYFHDEGFDVAGVAGNQIWLARRNGARGKIKQVGVSGSQKILTVDKNDFLGQLNFKGGDIIVVGNVQYTVDKVAESSFQLGYYDFTAPGANLNDFLTDYYNSTPWAIDAYGAYNTCASGSFNYLPHKQFWRREMIVETYVSPLSQFTSGTFGADQFGILFSFDPDFRNGSRNPSDGIITGSFRLKDSGTSDGRPFLAVNSKCQNQYADYWSDTSADTNSPTLRSILNGPHTQKIEIRNNFIKAYINNDLYNERWDSSGSHRGLFGVFAWNNPNVRFKTIKFSAVTQDLYITTANNFNVGDTVYESGTEVFHWAGERLLKIASKVTSPGTHDDLAFAYRGGYASNSWPVLLNYNGTNTSGGLMYLNQHNFTSGPDLYVDLGTGANTSVTVDLAASTTFTHVGFTPRVDDTGNAAGTIIKGIWIQGSNDNSSWTTIYGPADDTKRYCNPQSDAYPWYNQIGYYYTGTQTYRYVKFITNGNNGSINSTLNRYYKVAVFNMTSNNYTILVNNASDFANGDTIMVMGHSLYGNIDDFHHYQAVKAGQNLETYYHTANSHSTITNIVGNTLYLDRPINYSFVEGKESVIKINRNFKMLGFLSNNGETKFQKPYFKVNQGTNLCQIRLIKNWQFYNVGSSRVSGSSTNRGVDIAQQDNWNPAVIDGISVIGYNNSDLNGLTYNQGHGICRNGFVGNVRDYRPYYTAYTMTVSTFNMKASSLYRWRPEVARQNMTNYNEVAGARQWDVHTVSNSDAYQSPGRLEHRRNNYHGLYQIPANDITSRPGDAGWSGATIWTNEYNRHYATYLSPWNEGIIGEQNAAVGFDIHAEHPGAAVNNYRNEPFLSWFNNAVDGALPVGMLKDFMRADYNLCALNNGYMLMKQSVGTDYIRFYGMVDDPQYPRMSFTAFCTKAVPIQMYVEFEYRIPYRINMCQNTNVDNRIRIQAVQNGVYISGYPLYVNATDNGWKKFSTTVTTFNTEIGPVAFFIGRRDPDKMFDIRNARAYIMTNNPESVVTLMNTFDLNKYFNITNDKKYMAPISTGANKFKKVKF
jgi:hypothetical protein